MSVAGITVLGPLAVADETVALAPRDRVVLAALAVHPGEVVSAERLADALWSDQPPASWSKVVPGCIMRLRRARGSDVIETTPHGYRLTLVGDEIDAQRFERLVKRGRQLLTLGEPERAAHVIAEALDLWRGRALVDLEDWEPARIESSRLQELRLETEETRIDACLQAGGHREVLAEAQARATEAPLRERRWALLALAQYQGGRQGEALRTLHRARTVLATELGLDPGPDLVALEQAILRQDPALVAEAVSVEASARCPYLGLVPYDVADAEGFFGRDAEVGECLRRLAATGVLAVVGPSGCGKSSLVRAGIAATLRRDGRRVVIVSPGTRPLDALAALPADGDAVLVVDQCEQVVSSNDDAMGQSRFLAAVTEYAGQAPVVVAVRADRLSDLSVHAPFARMVERGVYLLGPMDGANLCAAIEGPAHQAGLLLEPGLVDVLARDVEGEPGALPLLSHALRQTWERREGRTLTVAGYRETGGIREAVARSAEGLYEQLPLERRPLLRDVLLRLVAAGPDGEPIRGRVARGSLTADPDHDQLIEQLVAARLVISDDEVVELAHEALARAWPRLRGWLDDDVEGQRTLRHLTGAADAWTVMGRPDSELYRGMRLTQALDWRQRSETDLTPTERDFLDTSQRLAVAEQRAAEDDARRGRRGRRRARVLVAGVAVLLVAAVVAALLAVRQRERADTAAVAAEARRVAAQSRDAADIDRSLLLAVEAVRLDDSPDTRASLLTALSRSPALIGWEHRGERSTDADAIPAVDVSPDGAVIAAGAEFLDVDTLELLGRRAAAPSRLEYRPDGEQLAVAAIDVTPAARKEFDPVPVHLVDAATFEDEAVQLGGLPDTPAEAWDLDYSADGRFLAVALDRYVDGFENIIMVWDVTMPERPIQQIEPGAVVWAVALSPDGRLLYVGTHEPALTVYDVASGEVVRSIGAPPELVLGLPAAESAFDGLEISPDGTTLAMMDVNEIVLYDAPALTERARLRGHTELVQTLQFSHDGTLLASGSDDRTIVVWDVATATQREQLVGHNGSVRTLAFAPDDATLYSLSFDLGLLMWDLRGDRRFIPRTAPAEPENLFSGFAVPAPDGQVVAYFGRTASSDWGGAIRFRDLVAGRLGEPIVTGHGNWGPTWRPPDWGQFATTDDDGFVHVWDRRSGELVAERRVAAGTIHTISYTPDGHRIVVAEPSGTVSQIDADTLEAVGPTVELGAIGGELAISPDQRRAVVMVPSATYAVIDLGDGRVVSEVDLGFDATWPEISPDGSRLAIGGTSGEVGLVDLESGGWIRPPTVGHTGFVLRVAYAPDGATFASSGHDGRVSLWDGRTGDLLVTVVPGRPEDWAAVEYLPDGHTVIIATRAGAVYTWDTRLERWIDFACAVAGRNLTAAEWRDVFGERAYRDTCPTG